jgi:hypothetical protein
VLISPKAKTADHTDTATDGSASFTSRFIGVVSGTGFYTKDRYYGWSALTGTGTL